MKIWKKIQRKLHLRALESAKKKRKLSHESKPFSQMKRVSLLFDATDVEVEKLSLAFSERLKKQGKQVTLLGYIHRKEKAGQQQHAFHSFSRAQVDWLSRPTGEAATSFMDTHADLLILISKHNWMWMNYIAALTQAKFRVGMANAPSDCYELMIDLGAKQDLKEYLQHVEFFLQKMHATNETSPL